MSETIYLLPLIFNIFTSKWISWSLELKNLFLSMCVIRLFYSYNRNLITT